MNTTKKLRIYLDTCVFNRPFDDQVGLNIQFEAEAKIHIIENERVLAVANRLIKLGIKSKDALHVACALEGHAQYFITTDGEILAKLKDLTEIIVINPVIFVLEMGAKEQNRK